MCHSLPTMLQKKTNPLTHNVGTILHHWVTQIQTTLYYNMSHTVTLQSAHQHTQCCANEVSKTQLDGQINDLVGWKCF